MKKQFILSMGVALLVLSACSPVRVVYVNQEAEKAKGVYQSFDFYETTLDNQAGITPRPENLDKLKEAIQKELEKKNIKRTSDSPDLLVNIGVTIKEEVQTRQTDIRDAPRYIGQRNYHWESQEVEVNRYKEGTVVVDIVDRRNNELIWEGAAASTIAKNQEKMAQRIDEAMEKLFRKFP